MAIEPPKCRTCGKQEWRHVCGGFQVVTPEHGLSIGDHVVLKRTPKATPEIRVITAAVPKPKTDRKEYLKLKARERRAAKKLSLSVAEYRAKQKVAGK